MKKLYLFLSLVMLICLIGAGCGKNETDKGRDKQKSNSGKVVLTVSAAASLQDSLNKIKTSFEKEHHNVKINYNFGASGALQQQISQGAPVDLFFSAAEDKFKKLVDEGLIDKDQGGNLVGNEIVLIVPKGAKQGINDFKDLAKAGKISLGTPESVPAGQYGKETLQNLKVWNSVENKVVYAKDVRQVLTYVETGNVDAGIVYKTDALISSKAEIKAEANHNTHGPIIYPAGVIKKSAHAKEAELFFKYLQNEQSMKTFEKFGFTRANK